MTALHGAHPAETSRLRAVRRGFPEAGQLVLVVEPGVKMLAHGPRVPFAEAVVQPLVVGVVESLLLQRPLQVPVDLGHETEIGGALPHPRDRSRPEERCLETPGPLEYVGQHQHGHVAAHTVALPRDLHELRDHRVPGLPDFHN
jgi:hypothetical protein